VTGWFTGPVRRPLLLLLLVAALVAGACGGDDSGAPARSGGGPDVTGLSMTDLATGDEVSLADALAAPPGTPVLAWFWAPF
jgi:hypothetical protein